MDYGGSGWPKAHLLSILGMREVPRLEASLDPNYKSALLTDWSKVRCNVSIITETITTQSQASEISKSHCYTAYTDGSVDMHQTQNSGSAFVIYKQEGCELEHITWSIGKIPGPYAAEVDAIGKAVERLSDISTPGSKLLILSDAQSVLSMLRSGPTSKRDADLIKIISTAGCTHTVTLRHVKAHTGIIGNTRADELANWQLQNPDQPQLPIEYSTLKSDIKRKIDEQLDEDIRKLTTGTSPSVTSLHYVQVTKNKKIPLRNDKNIAAQRIIAQLRTNNCPWLGVYLLKIEKQPSSQCPFCPSMNGTVSHLLNDCIYFDRARAQVPPQHRKYWYNLDDLCNTTGYVLAQKMCELVEANGDEFKCPYRQPHPEGG